MLKFIFVFSFIQLVFQISGHPHEFERIIGGGNATKGTMPYLVSIQQQPSEIALCVGTIINSEWILTSGWCFDKDIREMQVVAGDHILFQNEQTEQIRRINKIIIHPEYVVPNGDLAMYKMAPPLEFNQWVQPVDLDLRSDEPTGLGVTAGWGFQDDFTFPDNLKILKGLELISNEQCGIEWGDDIINDSMFCTAVSPKGPCLGDNGAPLMCMDEAKKWAQCGIVTVPTCGNTFQPPQVYTRISKYIDFINHVIETDGECSTGFECRDGLCLPPHYHCDGFPHCFDFEDEQNCDKIEKPKNGGRKTFSDVLSDLKMLKIMQNNRQKM